MLAREHTVHSLGELERIYGEPRAASLVKVAGRITPEYRAWIEAAPFAVLASAGAGELDCSPRGDAAGFVRIADDSTLLIPDRAGNNRIDTLRNIVEDSRVALLFLVPGVNESIRVNGSAEISTDPELLESFAVDGKLPRTVLIVTVKAVYYQCARAAMRSKLWEPTAHTNRASLPSIGDILEGVSADFDGKSYDAELKARLNRTLY